MVVHVGFLRIIIFLFLRIARTFKKELIRCIRLKQHVLRTSYFLNYIQRLQKLLWELRKYCERFQKLIDVFDSKNVLFYIMSFFFFLRHETTITFSKISDLQSYMIFLVVAAWYIVIFERIIFEIHEVLILQNQLKIERKL